MLKLVEIVDDPFRRMHARRERVREPPRLGHAESVIKVRNCLHCVGAFRVELEDPGNRRGRACTCISAHSLVQAAH